MEKEKPEKERYEAASEPEPAARPRVPELGALFRCPYCHENVTVEGEAWVACKKCLARHHAACWKESRACSACGERVSLTAASAQLRLVVALSLALLVGGVTSLAWYEGWQKTAHIAEHGRLVEPNPDPPRTEPARVEPPKVEPPKVEPPKVEPPKVEPPKVEAMDALGWYKRGCEELYTKHDYDASIADFTKALELDSRLAPAWNERGRARHLNGRVDDALADFARAIEADPKLAAAFHNRGLAWNEKNEWQRAVADFTRAIELDPRNLWPYTSRAAWRRVKGDARGAEEDLTKAIELGPAMGVLWAERGLARSDAGDQEGAIADCAKAIELDAPPRAFRYRGLAKKKKGDLKGALADFERFLIMAPSDSFAPEVRELVRGLKQSLR